MTNLHKILSCYIYYKIDCTSKKTFKYLNNTITYRYKRRKFKLTNGHFINLLYMLVNDLFHSCDCHFYHYCKFYYSATMTMPQSSENYYRYVCIEKMLCYSSLDLNRINFFYLIKYPVSIMNSCK